MNELSREARIEVEKWMEGNRRNDAQRVHDRAAELQDKLIDETTLNGRESLKALMLVNGGAAIAMLGFTGALAGKERFNLAQLVPIADSLVWFAGGLVIAVLCFGLSYLTNFGYSNAAFNKKLTWDHPYIDENLNAKWWRGFGMCFHWAAIVLALVSLGSFVLGIWSVSRAIVRLS